MINSELNSLSSLMALFDNEEFCMQHLERLRWSGNVISPFDSYSKVYKCKLSRYRCKNTGKYFNAKTNTIFHNSKIELRIWFGAIWLYTNSPKITSTQLAKELSLTQKTAWLMRQKIKGYMLIGNRFFETSRKSMLNNSETLNQQEKKNVTEWLELLKK